MNIEIKKDNRKLPYIKIYTGKRKKLYRNKTIQKDTDTYRYKAGKTAF